MEEACRGRNILLTSQRRTIIRFIAEGGDHPTVQDLHHRCLIANRHISLATVYRTIKVLEENGVIERQMFLDANRFEEIGDHHDHFIDVTSGKITEFRNNEIERLQRQIAKKYGFEIVRHRLDIYVKPIKKAARTSKTR